MRKPWACLLAGLLVAAACSSRPPEEQAIRSARGYPLGDLRIERSGRVLLDAEVEIADTPAARATGLMHVERLSDRAGMAFLFETPTRSPFYMRNTLIPLDIAFWDEHSRIVKILEMEPCRAEPCLLYIPDRVYLGAVEVNRGLLTRTGVRVGDRVTLARR